MASVLLLSTDLERDTWRAALAAARHAVIVASAVSAAIDLVREGGIDLIVADYDVPGGLAPFLQALDRLPDPPPFILVSLAADAPLISARVGAAAFLPKPCVPEELAALVKRTAGGDSIPDTVEDQPTRPSRRDG